MLNNTLATIDVSAINIGSIVLSNSATTSAALDHDWLDRGILSLIIFTGDIRGIIVLQSVVSPQSQLHANQTYFFIDHFELILERFSQCSIACSSVFI
jgi:hypothetical protein